MDTVKEKTSYGLVLATVLFDFREEQNLTVKQCIARGSLHATQWVRVEKGQSGVSLDIISKVAKVLQLEISELFSLVDARVKVLRELGIEVSHDIPDSDPYWITCVKKLSRVVLVAKTKFSQL